MSSPVSRKQFFEVDHSQNSSSIAFSKKDSKVQNKAPPSLSLIEKSRPSHFDKIFSLSAPNILQGDQDSDLEDPEPLSPELLNAPISEESYSSETPQASSSERQPPDSFIKKANIVELRKVQKRITPRLHPIRPLGDALKLLFNLESLDLTGITEKEYKEVAGVIGSLKELKKIRICSIEVRNVDFLSGMEGLVELDLIFCRNLRRIPKLSPSLISLDLTHTRVESLDFLENCTALTTLRLYACESLRSLTHLRNCTALTSLSVQRCWIPSLEGLEGCVFLTSLNLRRSWIESLKEIEKSTALKYLDLSRSTISSIESLKNFTALETLNVRWCKKLDSIEEIKSCKALKILEIEGCKNVSDWELRTLRRSNPSLDIRRQAQPFIKDTLRFLWKKVKNFCWPIVRMYESIVNWWEGED